MHPHDGHDVGEIHHQAPPSGSLASTANADMCCPPPSSSSSSAHPSPVTVSPTIEGAATGTAILGSRHGGGGPPPPSSTNKLYTLLYRDIRPNEGQRIFLPFLSTKDRLRLSECCNGLLDYRFHLSRVRLAIPSRLDGNSCFGRGVGFGVSRLLARQRDGLRYLVAKRSLALRILDDVADVGWCRVKCLNMGHGLPVDVPSRDTDVLRRILWRGGLRGIEKLVCDGDVEVVMRSLACGACPALTGLNLKETAQRWKKPVAVYPAACDILATTMISEGRLKGLIKLTVNGLPEDCFSGIARALQAGSCPALSKLDVSDTINSRSDWLALAELLRSGACPHLKVVKARSKIYFDDRVLPVMAALQERNWPDLTELVVNLGHIDTIPMASLMVSGRIPNIQSLGTFKRYPKEASLPLLEAIRDGCVSDLRHIEMNGCWMDERHVHVLGEILRASVCPQLESLCVCGREEGCCSTYFLKEDGVVTVLDGLMEGGCNKVSRLDLAGVMTGPIAAQALARVLESGSLSHLQELALCWVESTEDAPMANVIRKLRSYRKLRVFKLFEDLRGSVGHETRLAVHGAIQDNVWPRLHTLRLEYSTNDGAYDLAGVLATPGTLKWLETLELKFYAADCVKDFTDFNVSHRDFT